MAFSLNSPAKRAAEHDAQLSLLLTFEGKVRRKIFNALMEITRIVAADQSYRIQQVRDEIILQNIFVFDKILRQHYSAVISAFARRNVRSLNQKKASYRLTSRFDSKVAYFVQNQALEQAQLIGKTTREDLRMIIETGIEEGLGSREISKAILEQGEVFARSRADSIAITETHNAAMFGNFESAMELTREYDLKTKKEWIATFDARTRESHAEANGQKVDMDESFIVGGERMLYPGDPSASAENVIRCRCVLGYSTEEN